MAIIPEILRNFSLIEHSGNRLKCYNFNAFIAMFLIFKEYLALISNLRYIPKDYGIIEETLVFFILRLTLFRPKGEEEVRE